MDNLANVANVAEIIGAIIVIGGLIFAILQMRQTRQQRREMAAIELFRFFGNPEFTAAYKRILRLPEGLSADDIQGADPGLEESAMLICATMENIGVMTFQRIVPFMVVYNLIGESCPALWRKLAPWVEMLREEQDAPFIFEWFQWLSELLDGNHVSSESPAHETHKDWTPANLTNKL